MENNIAKNDSVSREELENLRANVQKKLVQLNIKLPQLAKLIGMPYQSLWRIVNEEFYMPNINSLYIIADYFETQLGNLFISPDLPQYIPILEIGNIIDYLYNGDIRDKTHQILSSEYIHESAFAVLINQEHYGIKFTSTMIFKPHSDLSEGIFLAMYKDKLIIINIMNMFNDFIQYIDLLTGNQSDVPENSVKILAIAVKLLVDNDLI